MNAAAPMPMPPTIDQRLAMLRSLPAAARSAFLAEALPLARPHEAVRLAAESLRADGAAAVGGLVRAGALGQAGTDAIAAAPGDLGDAVDAWLAESAASGEPTAVLAALSRRPDASVVRALAMHAGGRHAAVLAPALLATVRAILGPHGRRPVAARTRAELDAAALRLRGDEQALRQPASALALLLLGVPLHEAEDDWLAQALRRTMARVTDPEVAGHLLRWLSDERVGLAAARHLHRALDAHPAVVLRDAHLARAPARRRRLRRVDRPVRVAQAVMARLAASDDAAPATAVDLLAALDLSAPRRRAVLDALTGHARADVRLAAQRRRIADGELPPLDDPCAVLPARAALARDAARALPLAQLGTLTRHKDPLLRRRAAWRLAQRDPAAAAVAASLGSLPLPWRAALVATWMARDRAGILTALGARLAAETEASRLALVEVVRRAHLVADFEPRLLVLARDPSSRLSSAAIRALGAGTSSERVEVIRAGLAATDPRVQANAVEAAGESEALAAEALRDELLGSRRNRTRANAVRIAAERAPATGLVELRRMLDDDDPLHRISAIWVARTVGVIEAMEPLRTLARREPLAPVRVRAEAAVRWIAARTASRGPRPARRATTRERSA